MSDQGQHSREIPIEDNRLVIIDKNFIQKRNAASRLGLLTACGCQIVLSDNLVYELCDDSADAWLDVQRKCFDFSDHLVTFKHTAELLREERDDGHPVTSPEDAAVTSQLRNWFRRRQEYVPPEFETATAEAHEQREVETYERLAGHVRTIAEIWPDFASELRQAWTDRDADPAPLCSNFLADAENVRDYIRNEHGNRDDQDTYICGAENGLDERWFTYHHAKSILAVACVFIGKYGADGTPGRKFPNTLIDANYLALLNYADAIATNETSGDLNDLLRWIYGRRKRSIGSNDLPGTSVVEVAAYFISKSDSADEHDRIGNWRAGELQIANGLWERLRQPMD